MDVERSILALIGSHWAVANVELVGSRARGTATVLSDWDFLIEPIDVERLVQDLPACVQALEPLAGQWDRLSKRAVYMLILPGAIKVDLFPGDRPHVIEPPWHPGPDNLSDIDAHFWDWTLWLGGKLLARRISLVRNELRKLHDYVLGPLGATTPPASLHEAVQQYQRLCDIAERTHRAAVDHRLADAVIARLRAEGLHH
jgi:hypothetical protein